MADLEFRAGLFRGTAPYYDRFRLPYPPSLVTDLAGRSGADGTGRLLDLACGTANDLARRPGTGGRRPPSTGPHGGRRRSSGH